MVNAFTAANKYPRTVHNLTYVQWNTEISKWRQLKQSYYRPHHHVWPLPPYKRFRPMPPPSEGDEEPERRLKPHEPRGLKTPEQSFHFGLKHFHKDPSEKKLLVFDGETPLSYTINTESRVQFQNPNHLPRLNYKQNTGRFGPARRPCLGIVPRTLSIPPKYPSYLPDDPSWTRDCNTHH